MANYSYTPGQTTYNQFANPTINITNDNLRREYIGNTLYALEPSQATLFAMLSRYKKEGWHDPIFKSMEIRHSWQRRGFLLHSWTHGTNSLVVKNEFDKRGVKDTTWKHACYFILPKAVIQFRGTYNSKPGILTAIVGTNDNTPSNNADGYSTLVITPLYHIADDGTKTSTITANLLTVTAGEQGLVMGSAYAEGTGYESGWADMLGQTEGYMQIFKTVNDMFTGTMLSTEYRGVKNEAERVWREKFLEHKMDISNALMFGVGRVDNTSGQPTGGTRYTWGVIPYLQHFGKTEAFSYSTTGYDDFVDFLSSFFDPYDGNNGPKLVLASRKIIGWLNKLGNGQSFLGNTLLADTLKLDIQNVKSVFGFNMMKVNCIFGELNFIHEPLLRGLYENYAVLLDPKNIMYKYLNGNGRSRDTYIEKDVQTPGVDGRIDLILTEAGLEILLPETHRLMVWA